MTNVNLNSKEADMNWLAFWLQEYALQLRMNPKSAKAAKKIMKQFEQDCGDNSGIPYLHDLLVDAAHELQKT